MSSQINMNLRSTGSKINMSLLKIKALVRKSERDYSRRLNWQLFGFSSLTTKKLKGRKINWQILKIR